MSVAQLCENSVLRSQREFSSQIQIYELSCDLLEYKCVLLVIGQ